MKIRLSELRGLIREMLIVRTMVAPSRISGDGLYAAEFIPAGGVVLRWIEGHDRTFPSDYPESLPPEARAVFIELASWDGERWFLSGDGGAYFNHSDEPNVRVVPGDGAAAVRDRVAVRDILPGEELTMDYRDIGIDSI